MLYLALLDSVPDSGNTAVNKTDMDSNFVKFIEGTDKEDPVNLKINVIIYLLA